VSQWQGAIDWAAVGRTEIRYANVRIGDGLGHDADFDANWAGARAAGLIRGAYQFFRPSRDPVAQADIVVAAVGRLGPGELPVTIDVEAPSPGVDPATYTPRIHAWVDRVTAGTGRAPIVYTGRYYWDPYVASSDFAHLPLWHAQYTSAACPNINDRWSDWAFWQYTSTGRVAGIGGDVDRNRFNGTYDDLLRLAGGGLCTAHCEGTTIVGTDCGRGDCAAFGSRCVDDAVGVRCAFYACPDVGETTVCLDDRTLGTCRNGAIETGDCGAFAAWCSTAGGSAHCASVFCTDDPAVTTPAHETCLPDGRIAHCGAEGGLGAAASCPTGTICVQGTTTASCRAPLYPPIGSADAGPDAGPATSDAGAWPADATTVRAGLQPTGCRATPQRGSSGGLGAAMLMALIVRMRRGR
jgi:lysozyme